MKKITLMAIASLCLASPAWAEYDDERPKRSPEDKAKIFQHLDTDGDGAISEEEFTNKRKHRGKNPMDADGDGKVSKDEFVEDAKRRFEKADSNGDGYITRDEKKAHHGKMREKHQERKERRSDRKEARDDDN